jgi:Flp pilus assembly protein TadG
VRDNTVVVRLPARVRSQTGAELVEFALVLPILLLVFGGIVDFGLLLQRQQVVTNAAREGARLAAVNYPDGDVRERVRRFVQVGLNSPTLEPATTVTSQRISLPSGAAFDAKQVDVILTDQFLILGPIVSLAGGTGSFGTIALHAQTTMRVEGVAGGS